MGQRLIDADAIRKVYAPIAPILVGDTVHYEWIAFIKEIDKLPTIDAEPVRHGKWIIRDNPGTGWYRVTCSECGEDVTSTAPCIGFFPNAKVSWNYCPECGARMDEE